MERLLIDLYSVLLERSATAGILLAASFFGSAIASSGRLQNLSLLECALDHTRRHNFVPSHTFFECFLIAAGNFGDSAMVKRAWKFLADSGRSAGHALKNPDWSMFSIAARQTGLFPYCTYHYSPLSP